MTEDRCCQKISFNSVLLEFLRTIFNGALWKRWDLRSFLEYMTHVCDYNIAGKLGRFSKRTALGTRLRRADVHWYLNPGKAREDGWEKLAAGAIYQNLEILKAILTNIRRIFKFLWKGVFALLQCSWDGARSHWTGRLKLFNRLAED